MAEASRMITLTQNFTAARVAGLAAQAFGPVMGRRYANGRNYDHGPDGHKAVSVLSPYVRRRSKQALPARCGFRST